jgi:hypothetical protein
MTLVFSESKEGMQSALNIFQSYCDKWKLTVNINKKKRDKFSLCGTPVILEKQFDCLSLYRTQDLILSYIL